MNFSRIFYLYDLERWKSGLVQFNWEIKIDFSEESTGYEETGKIGTANKVSRQENSTPSYVSVVADSNKKIFFCGSCLRYLRRHGGLQLRVRRYLDTSKRRTVTGH